MFNSTSTHYYNEMNQVSQELRLAGFLSETLALYPGVFL